jgi:GNAT superfamily N-acetyltransferase
MKKRMPRPENNDFLKSLTFEPLSKSNWNQFQDLFGEKGACGNCWCMSFRLKKGDFEDGKIDGGNKNAMKKFVWENRPTGILGFYMGEAIAWCAFAPRENFPKLENSRVHKRIDSKPVWSIPCFFIRKEFRRLGISVELLKAVIEHARNNHINTIEAYPTIPTQEKLPDAFAWIGLFKSFERANFKIVDRTSKNRPMVRYDIE